MTINIGWLWNLKILVAGTMPKLLYIVLTIYLIIGKIPRVNFGN